MTEVKTEIDKLMNLIEDHSEELSSGLYLSLCNQVGVVFNKYEETTAPNDPTEADGLTREAMEDSLRAWQRYQTRDDREFEPDDDSSSDYVPPVRRSRRRRRRRRRNTARVGRPRGSTDTMDVVGSIQVRNITHTVYKTRRGKFKYKRPSGWAYIKQVDRIVLNE